MNYSVRWTPYAEARLAELWLEDDVRGVITAVANRIDADQRIVHVLTVWRFNKKDRM